MTSKKQPGERKWLKRILVAITAAVVTTLFTRKKVLAPAPTFDFQLPPAPNQPASQPHPHRHEPAADPTSEGLDTVTHEGDEGAVDLSDVGLDIDVDLELESEDGGIDLTSEGLDISDSGPTGALGSGQGYIRLSNGEHACPVELPIKGNATSHIYHLPGEPNYEATIPNFCFASEEIAQSMGFRPRKH